MKKVLIGFLGIALLFTGCSAGSKKPTQKDVMNFFETVYTSDALEDTKFSAFKFSNTFTEQTAYSLTAEEGIEDEDDFIELKKSFFKEMFDSVEYHVGEIVKEDDYYVATMYIAPVDFSYYNLENVWGVMGIYEELVEIIYPELSATERFDIVTELMDDKKAELVLKSGEVINISDLTSFLAIVTVMEDVISDSGNVILTNTATADRSDLFVPTFFEVPFEFTIEKGEIVPQHFNGEPASNVEEMTEVIADTNLHFATSSQVTEEQTINSQNFIDGAFDTSLFKDVKSSK